jgi:ubiquinone/menaquinone biosynthesis C-methylase UbiE
MDYEGASNHDARFFARLLGRVRPRRVLEMACGSGRVILRLAAALPTAEIVGVDSSIEMLARTASVHDAAESSVRERVSFVNGDMRDWPGAGGPSMPSSLHVVRCRTYSRSTIGAAPG